MTQLAPDLFLQIDLNGVVTNLIQPYSSFIDLDDNYIPELLS